MEEVKAWQSRPLDEIYPIVFLDCIVVKCRQEGKVAKVSVYLALGVNLDGNKELLGIWIAKTEGAKFWLSVITELQNRGVKDIFITCVDGLKGFPECQWAPQTRPPMGASNPASNVSGYITHFPCFLQVLS